MSISFTFVNMFQCNYVIKVLLCTDPSCSNCSCQEKQQNIFKSQNKQQGRHTNLIHSSCISWFVGLFFLTLCNEIALSLSSPLNQSSEKEVKPVPVLIFRSLHYRRSASRGFSLASSLEEGCCASPEKVVQVSVCIQGY